MIPVNTQEALYELQRDWGFDFTSCDAYKNSKKGGKGHVKINGPK